VVLDLLPALEFAQQAALNELLQPLAALEGLQHRENDSLAVAAELQTHLQVLVLEGCPPEHMLVHQHPHVEHLVHHVLSLRLLLPLSHVHKPAVLPLAHQLPVPELPQHQFPRLLALPQQHVVAYEPHPLRRGTHHVVQAEGLLEKAGDFDGAWFEGGEELEEELEFVLQGAGIAELLH